MGPDTTAQHGVRQREAFSRQWSVHRSKSAPLSGLAESVLSEKFRFWTGRSGRRYLVSVYQADDEAAFRYDEAVLIIARRGRDGSHEMLGVWEAGSASSHERQQWRAASVAGSDGLEVHVHLLASTAGERCAVLQDLRPVPDPITRREAGVEPGWQRRCREWRVPYGPESAHLALA